MRGHSAWPLWVVLSLVAALSVWGWSLHPEHGGRWLARMLVLPLMLGVVAWRISPRGERTREERRILEWHRIVFTFVGLIVALDLASQLSISAGLLDAVWNEPRLRVEGLLLGAGVAVWGNRLPTLLSPWPLGAEPFEWQRVHRFVGRLTLVAGVGLVLVWLTFPLAPAQTTTAWIVGGVAVTAVVRKLVSVATPVAGNSPSSVRASRSR